MTRKLSTITLYSGVEFDDTYKHVVNWDTQQQLDDFLNAHKNVSLTGSYQNINKPIRWNTKTETFNDLVEYNYCKITDVDHDGNTKEYYAYLTNFEYMNDGTTLIYFSIDIWNTYKFNLTLDKAYIQKAFVKELNNDGTDWSETFDRIKNNSEDIGGDGCEKLLASNPVYFDKIENNGGYINDAQLKFIVFTAQPKDAKTESGTLAGAYSEYLYFILAFNSQNDQCVDISIKGKKIVSNAGKNIKDVYKQLATVPEFAGSSSLIVDSEMYDYIGLPFEITKDMRGINFTTKFDATVKDNVLLQVTSATLNDFESQQGICYMPSKDVHGNWFQSVINWYQATYGNDMPLKLLCYPYSKLFFTDGKGTNMMADIGQLTNRTQANITMQRWSGITENGKQTYALNHYNRRTTNDAGLPVVYENKSTVDDSARDIPIVLDNYTMYLNANRNQLANTRANAKMNERLTKEGNALSVTNQERSMATARNVQNYQQGRNMGMAKMNAGLGILGGALNGLKSGGLIGGVLGGVGGAIQGGLDIYKQSYNNATASHSLAMQQATQAENMRANYAFQNKVATNNYEQTIRSQNAMLADVKNHNDMIAHQGSAYLYDYQNKNNNMHWQLFTCQDSVMNNVALYFKLFGYTVNLYDDIANYLNVKSNFNYIKTSNANVFGSVPDPALKTIDDMLDNGVTVWQPSALDKFKNRDYTGNNFK